jgi:hypothetical protein
MSFTGAGAGLMGQLTGLSCKSAANHMLGGEVQQLMQQLWTTHTLTHSHQQQEHVPNSDRLPLSDSEVESFQKIMNVFRVISAETDNNSYESVVKQNSLPVDMARCFVVYFTHLDQLSGSELSLPMSPAEILECFTSICASSLEEVCSDKHLDALASSLLSLASMVSPSGNLPLVYSFLNAFITTLSHLAASYSSSKKLFILCTKNILPPCLDLYKVLCVASSSLADNQPQGVEQLSVAVDSLLSVCLFDDLNNIKELSHISFESVESRMLLGDSKDDKKKKKDKKKTVFSYHADFLFVVGKWLSVQSVELGNNFTPGASDGVFLAGKSIHRVLGLYMQASKQLTTTSPYESKKHDNKAGGDQASSFVVKWRQHVKRLLHTGISLAIVIKASCSEKDNSDDSTKNETLFLLAWSSVLDSISAGLRGDSENGGSGDDDMDNGSIPNHDSMTPYLDYMKTMGTAVVENVIMRGTSNNVGNVLFAQILFLGKLFSVNYRSMLDILPNLIQIICKSCNDNVLLASSNDLNMMDYKRCRGVTELLLLQLLQLYTDIRNLDTFIQVLIVESLKYSWTSNNLVEQFYSLLTCERIQTVLISAVGGMPDGQRKLVWEAIYSATSAVQEVVDPSDEDSSHMAVCEGLSTRCSTRFFVLEAVLIPFLVAQESQNHRPVPTYVLTYLLQIVIDELRSVIDHGDMADVRLTSSFQLVAVIFQIAGLRLSASVFSPMIAPYPYDMVYDALTSRAMEQKPTPEQEWVDFCLIAASLLRNEDSYGGSSMKAIVTLIGKQVGEKFDTGDSTLQQYIGASVASCGKVIFAAVSLFAASSDALSPVARVLNKNEESASVLRDVFVSINTEIIVDFLALVSYKVGSNQIAVLRSYPFLCNLLMKEFMKWGCVVNDLLESDPSSGDLEMLNNLFMSLVQTSMSTAKLTLDEVCGDFGTERSLQSNIVDALSSADVEEIPFVASIIIESVGKLFDDVISQSDLSVVASMQRKSRGKKKLPLSTGNAFDVELLAFEVSLLQIPVKILCNNWESICHSCCNVLYLLSNKYSSSAGDNRDTRDVLLASLALDVLVEVTQEMISTSTSATASLKFVVTVLNMMVHPKTKNNAPFTNFVEQFSSVTDSMNGIASQIHHTLCDSYDMFLTIIFQFGFNKLLSSLLNEYDSHTTEHTELVKDMNVGLVMLVQKLRRDEENKSGDKVLKNLSSWGALCAVIDLCTELVSVNGGSTIPCLHYALHSIVTNAFSALVSQKPSLLEWNDADKMHTMKTFKNMQNYVMNYVEGSSFAEGDISTHYDSVSNCYKILVHLSIIEKITDLDGPVSVKSPSDTLCMSSDLDSCLVQVLTSTVSCVRSGWLKLLGDYLNGFRARDTEEVKSYLRDDVIEKIVRLAAQSIESTLKKCNLEDDILTDCDDYPVVLFSTVTELLNVTPPCSRENSVVKPMLQLVGKHIRMLSEKNIFEGRHFKSMFMSLFAITTALLEYGNSEWKEGTKEGTRNLKITYTTYRKSVTHMCCATILDIANILLSVHHMDLEKSKIFTSGWGYSSMLDFLSSTLRSQLKIELQLQSDASHLARKRKRHSKGARDAEDEGSDCVGLIFDTCFSFLAAASSQLVYLSVNGSRMDDVTLIQNFKSSACGLVSLLTDILSCVSVAVVNSYIGSIVLQLRHVLFIASSLIVSTHGHSVPSANNSGKEVMALVGRALMAAASSKHLQKHAYLIVSAIIDSISGLSSRAGSSHHNELHHTRIDTNSAMLENPLNFGEGNEILRENLFPGIFALFDRCRSARERKQIFASLRLAGGSRTLYTDLHTLYQQDFKFIGKA